MRSRRISQRGLASLVGTIIAWVCLLPVTVRASFGSLGFRNQHSSCRSNRYSDIPDGFVSGQRDFDMNLKLAEEFPLDFLVYLHMMESFVFSSILKLKLFVFSVLYLENTEKNRVCIFDFMPLSNWVQNLRQNYNLV
ncbi:hypothetical protein AVEN_28864-1 [Araneus ventricosus]|uniref:Uncharacterized protein n=1 Tax=Araneus ventricosus TaxID=182803 RepID=A0A4Y2FJ18_ARAVE|nr:hypothetical protein AVEN_28864-1 [Araneus ventricosus]